jgi:hypothetical protein
MSPLSPRDSVSPPSKPTSLLDPDLSYLHSDSKRTIQIIATVTSAVSLLITVIAVYFFLRMNKRYRHECVALQYFVSAIQLIVVKVNHDQHLGQRASGSVLCCIFSAGFDLWHSAFRIRNLSNEWILHRNG